MPDRRALLELATTAARRAADRLLEHAAPRDRESAPLPDLPREIKAVADGVLDEEILTTLRPAGLPILSEESGAVAGDAASGDRFIVDPLDGTVNFVRRLGPSAVSIALWHEQEPVFGVVYDLAARRLAWGGPALGAWCDDRPLTVSGATCAAHAAICTGVPARLDVASDAALARLDRHVRSFAKVRMLGSAAISLLRVAEGAADAYAEQSIMLWDVAAGLALVAGAGGAIDVHRAAGGIEHAVDVFAGAPALVEEERRRA